MKVRRNKFGHWETPCRGTDIGGNVYWYSMSVQFNKACAPSDDSQEMLIEPVNWFLSCFMKKDGTTAPKLVIMAYRPMGQDRPEEYGGGEDSKMFGKEIEVNSNPISSDDLPFY